MLTDPHRDNKFYAEVTFKSMRIKLGDFVKVSLEETSAGQLSTSICQVLALYDDVEGGSGIFMEARWFQTVAELSEKSRKMYVPMLIHNLHLRYCRRSYFIFHFVLSVMLIAITLLEDYCLRECYDVHSSPVLLLQFDRSIES